MTNNEIIASRIEFTIRSYDTFISVYGPGSIRTRAVIFSGCIDGDEAVVFHDFGSDIATLIASVGVPQASGLINFDTLRASLADALSASPDAHMIDPSFAKHEESQSEDDDFYQYD